MADGTPRAGRPTITTETRIDQYSRLLVWDPREPMVIVTVAKVPGHDTISLHVDAHGVTLTPFSGKRYKTPAGARKAADAWLVAQADRRAAERAIPKTITPVVRLPWMDEEDAIANEGYIVVHRVAADGTTTVSRGPKLP